MVHCSRGSPASYSAVPFAIVIRNGVANDHLLPEILTTPLDAASFTMAPSFRYCEEAVRK